MKMAWRVKVKPIALEISLSHRADIRCQDNEMPTRLKDARAFQQHFKRFVDMLDDVRHDNRVKGPVAVTLLSQDSASDLETSGSGILYYNWIKIYSFNRPS
jgi:hypothetical protein